VPLGMEVGRGPGEFVYDGDPARPRKKGHTHPHPMFGPCLLWLNGWMDEDATRTEVDLGPGHIVLDGVPAPRVRGTTAPFFGRYLLWPRSPISVTAELLATVNMFSSMNNMMLTLLGDFSATVLNGCVLDGSSLHSALGHVDF